MSETGRIYDRLVSEFGREHVFKDVDSIPYGVDFAVHLDKAVSQCQVVLVVIGESWAMVTDAEGRCRLANPDDFVRIEVESALKREIPVIPVLLEGVRMPQRSELPESLHALVRRNAVQVGDDPRFHSDVTRLINGMKALMGVTEVVTEPVTEVVTEPDRREDIQASESVNQSKSQPPSLICAELQKDLAARQQDYEAVSCKRRRESNPAEKNNLTRQLTALAKDLAQIEQEMTEMGCDEGQ